MKSSKTKKMKVDSLKQTALTAKKTKLLSPEKMTYSFLVTEEIEEKQKKVALPFEIKASDKFRVIGYNLKIRETRFVHHAADLPAQHYLSAQKSLESYLSNETDIYKTCFCPIYFVTSADCRIFEGYQLPPYTREELLYVGQTNSTKSRFRDGHSATQRLNNFEYANKLKAIFMTQIYIDFEIERDGLKKKYEDFALEWLKFEDIVAVPTIIDFVEYFLIFGLRPDFNKDGNPRYSSGEYLKEPKVLEKYNLNPSSLKVSGIYNSNPKNPNFGDLLSDYDALAEITARKTMFDASIDFFEKYGLIPKTR